MYVCCECGDEVDTEGQLIDPDDRDELMCLDCAPDGNLCEGDVCWQCGSDEAVTYFEDTDEALCLECLT
jgi:hypothetical protein